jgi:hypothetical protein
LRFSREGLHHSLNAGWSESDIGIQDQHGVETTFNAARSALIMRPTETQVGGVSVKFKTVPYPEGGYTFDGSIG